VLVSAALPNTLTAINRMTWDYIPERTGDTPMDSFANVVKARIFMGDEMPRKLDLFGRPIPQNPEGTIPWVYQLLDLTRSRKMPSDPLYNELYQIYAATLDPEVVPTQPYRTVKNPVTKKDDKLTEDEYRKYMTLIGQARAHVLTQAMNDPRWPNASPEQKAMAIKRRFGDVRTRAVEAYWVQRYYPERVGRLAPVLQTIIAGL